MGWMAEGNRLHVLAAAPRIICTAFTICSQRPMSFAVVNNNAASLHNRRLTPYTPWSLLSGVLFNLWFCG